MIRLSSCGVEYTFLFFSVILLSSPDIVAIDRSSVAPRPTADTWYSVGSGGNWSDATTWNKSPLGLGASGVPTTADEVVIRAGDVIVTDRNNLQVAEMKLEGTLNDNNAYTGHDWGTMTGSGTLIVRETLPAYSNSPGFFSTGTVVYEGTEDYALPSSPIQYYNVSFQGSGVRTISNDLTVTNDLYISEGVIMNSGGTTLTVGGDWTNDGAYQGSGTVVFNGTAATHTISGSSGTMFGSLEIDGIGSTFLYNNLVTIASDLTVKRGTFTNVSSLPLIVPGNLTINALGVLDATKLNPLTVHGNWTNEGTFTAGLQNVVFGGSTTQTLTGETYFYGLEKANGGRLILNSECTVTGMLSLTEGYIQTLDASVLELGALAYVIGGSDNSYLEGPMLHATKVGVVTLLNSVKIFPFGSKGKYRPATLSVGLLGALTTVYYRGELLEGPPPTRNLPGTIDHVSQLRYYRINQPTILPPIFTVEATVSIAYNTDDVVDNPSELRLVKSDGDGNWVDIGGAGSSLIGTITSTVFSSFSDFVLSSSTENNPLPVELLSLTAQPREQAIQIRWSTASETDNSHFVVERSSDGEHFVHLATLPGAGTSQQEQQYEVWDWQPLSGTAYYRLRQVDFDGEQEYSRPVSVEFVSLDRLRVRLHPNPADEKTTLSLRGLAPGQAVEIQLISPGGKQLDSFRAQTHNMSPLSVDLEVLNRYPSGMYTVVVRSENFYWSEKLLIE